MKGDLTPSPEDVAGAVGRRELEISLRAYNGPLFDNSGIRMTDSARILALLDHLSRVEGERDEFIAAARELTDNLREATSLMSKYAREAGEAKGRLEMSEAAGVVDMWRDHANAADERRQAAEARSAAILAVVEEAGEALEQARDEQYTFPEGGADPASDLAARLGKSAVRLTYGRRPSRIARSQVDADLFAEAAQRIRELEAALSRRSVPVAGEGVSYQHEFSKLLSSTRSEGGEP